MNEYSWKGMTPRVKILTSHSHLFGLFLLLLLLNSGCAVHRIAPASADLTISNSDTDAEPDLRRLVLGIENASSYEAQYYLDAFISSLQAAAIFESVVVQAKDTAFADLVISDFHYDVSLSSPGVGEGFLCFEPYLLVISLGLIPSVCDESRRLSFSLRSADGRMLKIDEKFRWKSVAGWAALPLAASNDWKFTGAFEDFLRALLWRRAQEIKTLASGDTNS